MRIAMKLIGILAIIVGVIWMGQDSGYFPYPASSFMIDQSPWIAYGAIVAVIGALLLWMGRRKR